VQRVVSAGRHVVFLVTYHYSQGDPRRGCAGFQYDTAAAIAHTDEIRRQIEHIFGSNHDTVYPLVCGFETDEDALVIHGTAGDKLDLATLNSTDRATLELRLAALLPDMPARMRADLLPLLYGNLEHIENVRAQIRRNERLLDIEHREWMICLGRGFDFLHTPNIALIIGPYSPNLDVPIRRAAGIIEANMHAGRIPSDGFLLLASVPYDEIGRGPRTRGTEVALPVHFRRRCHSRRIPATRRTDVDPHGGARLAVTHTRNDCLRTLNT
jgi:hypothetical protein